MTIRELIGKAVTNKKLTKAQATTLLRHQKHHTEGHMLSMIEPVERGELFSANQWRVQFPEVHQVPSKFEKQYNLCYFSLRPHPQVGKLFLNFKRLWEFWIFGKFA